MHIQKVWIFLGFFTCVRAAHNPKVVGSNPAPATKLKSAMQLFWEMAVKTRNFCIALFLSILLDFSRFVKGKTEKNWSCTVVQLIFVHSEISRFALALVRRRIRRRIFFCVLRRRTVGEKSARNIREMSDLFVGSGNITYQGELSE